MAETYRVAQIVNAESWTGRDGTPMRTQEVALIGPDGVEVPQTIKVHGKQEFKAVEQGQSIFGEIQNGKFSFRRQDAQTQANGGGVQIAHNTISGSSPARTDATGLSIERQVAAKCTAELIGPGGYASIPDDQLAREIRRITDAFAAAIRGGDETLPF